ncbi:BSD domain-containing protein [Artemisia annua]|uniref:BSD domain-containing protein n=1 Tax=Artemisia annua TaxID=35608 RepID=A0A2U1LN03_ARTAN|nr:BSD domain-containing protein [Artemisia annua]
MSSSSENQDSGKKQDFSIKQTFNRQLTNFTSFLAPPPLNPYNPQTLLSNSPENHLSGELSGEFSGYEGVKNDLAEISISFKKSVSLLSPKKAVNELHKVGNVGVGVNDEVLEFVREVAVRPEFWVEFPVSLRNKDFNMSDVQKDHASAIEQLVPDLTTLKHKMLNCMSGQQFWLIYFILLIPRLNEDDSRLLSTPEIDQVREVLLQQQKNTHDEKGSMVNSTKQSEGDQTGDATNRLKNKNNEDDVSFSDVEIQSSRLSSASENSDWVRLSAKAKANRATYRERHSESEESSDWHAVEDTDL